MYVLQSLVQWTNRCVVLGNACKQLQFRESSLEFLDPFLHLQILLCTQVTIVTSSVPRVKGVETNHEESLFWKSVPISNQHSVEIL